MALGRANDSHLMPADPFKPEAAPQFSFEVTNLSAKRRLRADSKKVSGHGDILAD
jgi:hypothetical protein